MSENWFQIIKSSHSREQFKREYPVNLDEAFQRDNGREAGTAKDDGEKEEEENSVSPDRCVDVMRWHINVSARKGDRTTMQSYRRHRDDCNGDCD